MFSSGVTHIEFTLKTENKHTSYFFIVSIFFIFWHILSPACHWLIIAFG